MEKTKQVWEYPTVMEVVYELVHKRIKEEKRHLIIGMGIVLGSKKAYEKQGERYGPNPPAISLAEESGMIAEEIKKLVDSPALPENLEKAVEGIRYNGIEQRIYGYIKSEKLTSPADLKGVGKLIEDLVTRKENETKFNEFKTELKDLMGDGDFGKKELCDPTYLSNLITAKENDPRYPEIKKKYNLLIVCQRKIGEQLVKENKDLNAYLREYRHDHY